MKQLLIIIVLAIVGYFAYQYFLGSPHQDSTRSETESNKGRSLSNDYLPPIPGQCEDQGKNLGNAIYGRDIGRVSVGQANHASRTFQTCLLNAGFSESQVSRTVIEIKESVMKLDPGSARGY